MQMSLSSHDKGKLSAFNWFIMSQIRSQNYWNFGYKSSEVMQVRCYVLDKQKQCRR